MKLNYRHLLFAALAVSAAITVTSCGSDDPDDTSSGSDDPDEITHFDTTISMQGHPFVVSVAADGTATVSPVADCTIRLDRDRQRANIEADDFTFANLKFTIGSDGHSFTIDSVGVNAAGSGDRLTVSMLYSGVRNINATECTGVGLRLATSRNSVNYMPRELLCSGVTTTVLTTVPDSSYVSKETTYTITIDPASRTAEMIVHRPKFAANMPALGDMTFPGINVTFTAKGFTLEKDNLTPLLDGTPYPRYAITDLKATYDLTTPTAAITFSCMRVFRVTSEVSSNFAPND